MRGRNHRKLIDSATGLLARLRQDKRGNVLAMMAAMMVPLAALSGSAIDMGRLYAVKSRLQQACDAGALAGRKMMISSSSSTLDQPSIDAANAFFSNNFKAGWYQTSNVTFKPTLITTSEVQGVASAVVPMTIMQMVFQVAPQTVTVNCTARYDVSDSDIMFVLDTTGSMADILPGSSSSKISGLKSAVLSFYDTLDAALKDNPGTHIRYGFLTYSSAVNVGRLLYQLSPTPLNYLAPKVLYQTRIPATGSTPSNPKWTYLQNAQDASAYIPTVISGALVADPTKTSGTTTWKGCIEERPTQVGSANASDYNQNNLPYDLDPDLAPSANVDGAGVATSTDTRWRPMWPSVIYDRGTTATVTTTTSYSDLSNSTCPKPALSLNVMTRDDVSNYVNASDFTPAGSTYLDIGMIWGTRMISPNGIFAATTAAWPGRPAPNRYIVFMTDGVMDTNRGVYGTYGIESLDQRISGGAGSVNTDNTFHYSRFLAECTAAKNRNITIFTIGFGSPVPTQLKTCASPGKYFAASNNTELTKAFQQIAQQVAMLRLSQ